MKLDLLKAGAFALAVGSTVSLGACSQMTTGGTKSPVGGSAGGANSANAAKTLEHCAKPLGTLAVDENTSDTWYIILTTQYHLPATTPLIRLMIQQSNCFVIVDRGRALNNLMQERDLGASGELRNRSNMGKGQMVAADYVVTPTIQFSQETGGGAAGALGGLGGYGALIGAVVGSMRTSEASTTLMLVDSRSGVQVAAAQGSAHNTDFGFGALGLGAGGGGAMGAYSKTPQGKVIAGAFLDSYNELVRAVRAYAPQSVAGGLGTGGSGALAVDGASRSVDDYSVSDAQRKLAGLGLYAGKVDGRRGPGTAGAISKFQKIRGLPVSGDLDEATMGALKN